MRQLIPFVLSGGSTEIVGRKQVLDWLNNLLQKMTKATSSVAGPVVIREGVHFGVCFACIALSHTRVHSLQSTCRLLPMRAHCMVSRNEAVHSSSTLYIIA